MKRRIPLRVKISLVLFIIYLLNVAAILIYVNFSLSVDIKNEYIASQNEADTKIKKYISSLSESSDEDIVLACQNLQIDDKTLIEITDIEDNIVCRNPETKFEEEFNSNRNSYIKESDRFFFNSVQNGRQLYFITVYSHNVTEISYYLLLMLILYETVIVAILLIIFSFYITMTILNPLYALGEKIRSFKLKKNIEVKTYSNEIEQLDYEFDMLIDSIEQQQQRQNRIIASMSHDIKTPLTSILGYAEQLKKDGLPPERRQKYVNTIYDKANTIKDLIINLDQYLSYNSINDSIKVRMTVDNLLSKVSAYFENDLNSNDVKILFNNYCKESIIEINELSILRVFGNLIGNSIKHKRADKKLILEVSCTPEKENVVFSFSDNGEGVEQEKINNIFEPFYTTDESRSKAVSGLGLSICKEIITEHGGEIWANPSKSGGLCVSFTIKTVK